MADIERKLQMLAERGTPIGPDELIARLERELADGRLHGATGWSRRRTRKPGQPTFWRGMAWAMTAFVIVLATGALLYLFSTSRSADVTEPEPIDRTPTTTAQLDTGSPEDDVAIFEAAVAGWFGNDFEAASQYLDIPGGERGWNERQVRDQMAYEEAIGARADGLTCSPPQEQGMTFECEYALRNAVTDALGLTEEQLAESTAVKIVDGRVSRWGFTDHMFVNESFATYLAIKGTFAGYNGCVAPPLRAECAQIQPDHLDAMIEWNLTASPEDVAREVLAAWPAGVCELVTRVAERCVASMAYEIVLNGTLVVSSCAVEEEGAICEVGYRNVLIDAADAGPVPGVVTVEIDGGLQARDHVMVEGAGDLQDESLLLSFRQWAVEAGIGEDLDRTCGATTARTSQCAAFMLENLDDWAAWHLADD